MAELKKYLALPSKVKICAKSKLWPSRLRGSSDPGDPVTGGLTQEQLQPVVCNGKGLGRA